MRFSQILAEDAVIWSLEWGWKIFQGGSLTCLAIGVCYCQEDSVLSILASLQGCLSVITTMTRSGQLPLKQAIWEIRVEMAIPLWPSPAAKNRMIGQTENMLSVLFLSCFIFFILKTIFGWEWGCENDRILFNDWFPKIPRKRRWPEAAGIVKDNPI